MCIRDRIREVTIGSGFSWWKDDYMEFYFNLNKRRIVEEGIGAGGLFSVIRPIYGRNMEIGSVLTEEGTEKIRLSSRQSEERDVWAMRYYPFQAGGREYKMSELAIVEKGQMPQEVAKENQQYRLCLQYEYIGSSEQGRKLLKLSLIHISPEVETIRKVEQALAKETGINPYGLSLIHI